MTRRAILLMFLAGCGGGTTGSAPDAGGGGPAPLVFHGDLGMLDEALLAVALGDDEAVAVGGDDHGGIVLEWSGGATWRAPLLPDGTRVLWWAWASGDDVYAVGEGGQILARRSGLWRQEPVAGLVDPMVTFYGVWGAGPRDVWVVGGSINPGAPPIAIVHFDGDAWTALPALGLPAETLFKVWGSGARDVWAVGKEGTILHFDGETWSAAVSPTGVRLVAVFGRAADEVYAVGGDASGEVLRWDGEAWTRFAATTEPLSGVWTAPGRALYVAGNNGFLARYGASDTAAPEAAALAVAERVPGVDFHSIDGRTGQVLAVGADLLGDHADGWQGALVSHGAATASRVVADESPDAGPPDAAPPDAAVADASAPDATLVDAARPDAGRVDARPADAGRPDARPGPPDARWPSEGEDCVGAVPCQVGLQCWYFEAAGHSICTRNCAMADECGNYGPGSCCRIPGPQTLQRVCVPGSYPDCQVADAGVSD